MILIVRFQKQHNQAPSKEGNNLLAWIVFQIKKKMVYVHTMIIYTSNILSLLNKFYLVTSPNFHVILDQIF